MCGGLSPAVQLWSLLYRVSRNGSLVNKEEGPEGNGVEFVTSEALVEWKRNKGLRDTALNQHKLAGMMSVRTCPEVVSLWGFSKCFLV